MTPPVSYLLAVYNGAATVADAVESVLAQTFRAFEFVIVDDGSTDNTAELLTTINDPRIRLILGGQNLGLAGALNRGLAECRGDLVARMDADDLALPNRTEVQVAYLDSHPDVGIVGSFVETFPPPIETIQYPTAPEAATATMLFRSSLAHPAVMFRRRLFEQHALRYERAYRYAQDYALWLECVKHGIALANVDQVLLRYRVHGNQLSHSMDDMQAEGTAIRSQFLKWYVGEVREEDLLLHDAIARNFLVADAAWMDAAVDWLERLAATNERRQTFPQAGLLRVLTGRYVALVRFARQKGVTAAELSPTFSPFILPGALG
jgi:hypothetical protein